MSTGRAEILKFITSFILEHGYPPTRKEIARGVGYKTNSAVQEQLVRLQRDGKLELRPNTARGIRLITPVEDPAGGL